MSRHCYLCDMPIPAMGFRRWVVTSGLGYGRVYVTRRGLSAGSATGGQRTGLRTVCLRCADQLDEQQALASRQSSTFIAVALAVIATFVFVSWVKGSLSESAPTAIHQTASPVALPH